MGTPDLSRWTPFVYLFPDRYVDEQYDWESFDLERWSREEYTWEQDYWNGLKDVAQEPRETIETGAGDCEDYALVALSDRVAAGADGTGLGFLFTQEFPPQGHVIAYDEDRIYSSGVIQEASVDEYHARSDYDVLLQRDVR